MAKQKKYLPLRDTKSVAAVISKIAIFAGLSDRQLNFIFRFLQKVSYRAEEFIFRQGEEPSHIYIVCSGKVKIFVSNEDITLELIIFEAGQCFGESSIIAVEPHSANAIAVEDTELIVLSRKALFSIFSSDKEIFSLLILNIAREALP
jgi:CRP-like cAMP-binding protein